jgi:alpha-L-fucosidase
MKHTPTFITALVLITAQVLAPMAALHAGESTAPAQIAKRNLPTDETRTPKVNPDGASDHVPKTGPADGQHLALTMQKLENGVNAPRLFQPPLSAAAALAAEKETDLLVLDRLERFQDWKFGFFVHWGIYSQWGSIESWPLVEKEKWGRPDDLEAWLSRGKNFSRFSQDYRALNQTFCPKRFDPAKWAAAAKDAGMRYVVFTTKHHDGFCMFDTRQTDYRTTHPSCSFHTDPKADIAKAVFEAFRPEGFGIGAYYSKSDWHHPGYWAPEWPHPDRNVNYDTREHPEKWAEFVGFTHRIVKELMTGYGPIDILWLDGGQVQPPKQDIDMPRLAAMARQHQPGLIVVDRTVHGRYENYRTPEQKVPVEPPPYVWETCMTMGEQWSYKLNDKYKSTRQLVHLLVDIVAKGGNFLLNVGPDADGQLPPPVLERMAEIGRWMRVNGEAIYGTRAVPPYKQGRVCLTKKGDKIYAILLAGENETRPPSSFAIPALRAASHVRMLGVADAPGATLGADGLIVSLPPAALDHPPCEHAWTFEIAGAQFGSR